MLKTKSIALMLLLQGVTKLVSPKIFAVLSSRLEFQSEILSTYIYSSYAHMHFKVIRITVTSSGDFSVLGNFHREMHS